MRVRPGGIQSAATYIQNRTLRNLSTPKLKAYEVLLTQCRGKAAPYPRSGGGDHL